MNDYKVHNIELSDLGKKEIEIAKSEMPGLINIQKKYGKIKPLLGARIAGCLHVTVQTAVLIETLIVLGAEVRWSSSNVLSTQNHIASALARNGVPVFAWKGETDAEYFWCIQQTIHGPNNWKPNLIIDDGGDLVDILHNDDKYKEILSLIIGGSEETTSGINKVYNMFVNNKLKIPIIDVNNAVTKSKFDNFYGCRESIIDGLKQAVNIMIAGKIILIIGYGNVGKGCAKIFKSYGAIVLISEIDPICALQAAMDGYQVAIIDDIVEQIDIIVTATGNYNVVKHEHILRLKNYAILCNIGHSNIEIDIMSLKKYKWINIKPQVDKIILPNKKCIILLSEGRLVNLGCASGHSSFVMSISFSNQVFAQIELFNNRHLYTKHKIYNIPKYIDETVANLHLQHVHAKLSYLTDKQADYINVNKNGPFKHKYYHY